MGTKTTTGAIDQGLRVSTEAFQYTDFLAVPGFGQKDHFMQFVAGSSGFAAGGMGLAFANTTNHPGIWQLNTGALADGRAFVISGALVGWNLGANKTRFGAWMFLGVSGLSTLANRYIWRAGFGSVALAGVINFGVFFEYTDDENGGRWQALTIDGVGETSTDTGVTVVAETWYKFEAEVNAAGTEVEFFLDGVLVATNTTNIPTGDTYDHFMNHHIIKLTGLSARNVFIDATYLQVGVTR